jgi:hypothetical protein
MFVPFWRWHTGPCQVEIAESAGRDATTRQAAAASVSRRPTCNASEWKER